MKIIKSLLAAALIVLFAVPAYASGHTVTARIPVENRGTAGYFALFGDKGMVDEAYIGEQENGLLCAELSGLDSFEFKLRQTHMFEDERTVYDEAEYTVRIVTTLSEDGIACAVSAEKDGVEGKAGSVLFSNYMIPEDNDQPETGDGAGLYIWGLLFALSLAGLLKAIRKA